jgi:hypothetical protein
MLFCDSFTCYVVQRKVNFILLSSKSSLTGEAADAAGQSIQTSIIPAIAALRERHRLSFSSLFSSHLVVSHLDKSLGADLDLSSDLDISDSFFNSMTFR